MTELKSDLHFDAKELVFELDSNLGAIGGEIEILFGAKELLYDIKREMDDTAYRGDRAIHLNQVHSKLSAIHELIRHSLNDLNEAYGLAFDNKDKLCESVVQKNKKAHPRGNEE